MQEASVKLEKFLADEPLNEVIAGKLALVYKDLGETLKAVEILCKNAKTASDKGKGPKALALYKQALAILPDNPKVLAGLAEENEQLGRFSEAVNQSRRLLKILLKRKRYVEALECCARLVRCVPDEADYGVSWLDMIRKIGDEDRLQTALVVMCGPPGIKCDKNITGGDPTQIDSKVYEKLISLIDWFPADPTIPYAIAWTNYQQKNWGEAYRNLIISYERDPDYSLTLLLFSRFLVDHERLDEAGFLFSHIKDSVGRDQKGDRALVMEQINLFEQKNGWLSFNEGLLESSGPTSAEFLAKIKNEEIKEDTKTKEDQTVEDNGEPIAPPMEELDIGIGESTDMPYVDDEFEATSMITATSMIDLSEAPEIRGEAPPPPAPPAAETPPAPPAPSAPPQTTEPTEGGLKFNFNDDGTVYDETTQIKPGEEEEVERTMMFSPMDEMAASNGAKP